ncbi:MarR family winged helix-turn-helix transcriptional regulator [Arthrobacter sp. H20]|uniref:MarR family winged helix-turn-helix transcriptional regulator n=1 Tax=Arthrobacter sp. H20 TaxID=1267981 RepID=UPI00055E2605|nr:MarR family winged helix-turn-helix transcriptional regulator [Arthrobacter sp. H20]
MDLRQSTVFKLHRATTLVNRVSDEYLLTHHGIHYAPFLVLLAVRIAGPSPQQAIAHSLDVSRASVTQRIQQLKTSGLVDVTISSKDPRANVVDLTLSGRRLTDTAWHGLEAALDSVDDGVDDPGLRRQLDRLISNCTTALTGHNA